MGRRACSVGGLLAALAATFVTRGAANAASRTFFESGRSDVVLEARSNPPVRVARVDLALDFRREGRGPSSATYRLENESDQRWEDDVVFVLDAGGKGFGANARLTGDLVFYDKFGVSLGAETDFTRTVSGVATVATGSASAYGSGYVGAGAIVAVKPGVAAGVEVNAGGRLLVVPLDLAVQVYPYRDEKAEDIGRVRVLVGVKFGL